MTDNPTRHRGQNRAKMNLLSYGWQWHIDWTPIIIGAIILLVILYFLIFPLLIGKAAKRHGRSSAFWFLVALLISPLLAILILLLLGDTDAKRREKIINEELLRNSLRSSPNPQPSSVDNQQLQQLLRQTHRS